MGDFIKYDECHKKTVSSFIIFVLSLNLEITSLYMLSKYSKYALKALTFIVTNSSEEKKLLVKEIADKTKVPKPFLSKILQELASKDILSSTKGPGGGFYATPKQLDGNVLDIIVETEGMDKLQHCILNFENCDSQNPCPLHSYIAPARDALRQSLKSIKLEDLKKNGSLSFFT